MFQTNDGSHNGAKLEWDGALLSFSALHSFQTLPAPFLLHVMKYETWGCKLRLSNFLTFWRVSPPVPQIHFSTTHYQVQNIFKGLYQWQKKVPSQCHLNKIQKSSDINKLGCRVITFELGRRLGSQQRSRMDQGLQACGQHHWPLGGESGCSCSGGTLLFAAEPSNPVIKETKVAGGLRKGTQCRYRRRSGLLVPHRHREDEHSRGLEVFIWVSWILTLCVHCVVTECDLMSQSAGLNELHAWWQLMMQMALSPLRNMLSLLRASSAT